MVSFNNITLNQPVEVRRKGWVYRGVVKYKGTLNGFPGDWVGVALSLAVGDHDGMISGRRYFSCMEGHGIFTQAHEIRFQRMKRSLYNNYRSLKKNPQSDAISVSYPNVVGQMCFSRAQSVCSKIPSSSMRRPKTARSSYNYVSQPIHREYEDDSHDFISAPSIPNIHMPQEALQQQEWRGWESPHTHLVREWSVHTARDSFIFNTDNTFM